MYDELPDNLKPATFEEEAAFSSEMVYSEAPFGVHKYYAFADPASPQLHTMLDNCPEMWGIFPVELVNQEEWKKNACGTSRTQFTFDPQVNITFDPRLVCP